MDQLERYRNIIEEALARHIFNSERDADLQDKTVFDRHSDSYLVLREGWEKGLRVHAVVAHIELRNGKIWVQEDWTEHGVATDLEELGIPKTEIVLGFQPPDIRPFTEYATA